MNSYSNRWWRAAAGVAMAVMAGACGGDSDEATPTNKADWQEEFGTAISVVSDDIDRSNQALNAGERAVLLSTCTQLQEELGDARDALPVPEPTVDSALRGALDATEVAARTCVDGARIAGEAHRIEQAQREMQTARQRFDEAQRAIDVWQ
ncbi:MAG: hypothetical protein ACRD1D_00675 [Acidimicrobiales bacterium]